MASSTDAQKPAATASKQYVDITSNIVPEVDEFSMFYSNPKVSKTILYCSYELLNGV
jgi:hypothetical protein